MAPNSNLLIHDMNTLYTNFAGDGAGNSFFVASGANDDKKRAAMERIKAFNEAQAKKRAASGIPAPAPPMVADPSAVAGQKYTVYFTS